MIRVLNHIISYIIDGILNLIFYRNKREKFNLNEWKKIGRIQRDTDNERNAIEAAQELSKLRYYSIEENCQKLKDIEFALGSDSTPSDHIFRMAATDLFVEKAQHILTLRSSDYRIYGMLCFLLATITLSSSIAFLGYLTYENALPPGIENVKKDAVDTSWQILILIIFKATAFGGFVLVLVKIFFSLGKSFMHEYLLLRSRRHALRFGRLYVYLNKGKEIKESDLIEAFQWNREATTSFSNLDVGKISETLLAKYADIANSALTEGIKAANSRGSDATNGKPGTTTPKQRPAD